MVQKMAQRLFGNKPSIYSHCSELRRFDIFRGGLILSRDLYCGGSMRQTKTFGVVVLEVVPSHSGLAELDIRFDEVGLIDIFFNI